MLNRDAKIDMWWGVAWQHCGRLFKALSLYRQDDDDEWCVTGESSVLEPTRRIGAYGEGVFQTPATSFSSPMYLHVGMEAVRLLPRDSRTFDEWSTLIRGMPCDLYGRPCAGYYYGRPEHGESYTPVLLPEDWDGDAVPVR